MNRALISFAFVSVATGFLVGCGGLGALLGQNADAIVTVNSANANSLDLIIAAAEGTENDPTACTVNSDGFGCTRTVNSSSLSYQFRTNEVSAASPYNIYIKNLSNTPVTETLIIQIDGRTIINKTNTVPANQTFLAAKIFRDSAQ